MFLDLRLGLTLLLSLAVTACVTRVIEKSDCSSCEVKSESGLIENIEEAKTEEENEAKTEAAAVVDTKEAKYPEEESDDERLVVDELLPVEAVATAALEQELPADPQPEVIEADLDIETPKSGGNHYQVDVSYLNVRNAPSMHGGVIRVLRLGDNVKILGREGIWAMIGEREYVSVNFLKASN